MPDVFSYLNISTGHVTEEDMRLLESGAYPLTAASYEYGVFVGVPGDPITDAWIAQELQPLGYSPALSDVIALAQEVDCTVIRFDREASFTDQLPTYDW